MEAIMISTILVNICIGCFGEQNAFLLWSYKLFI